MKQLLKILLLSTVMLLCLGVAAYADDTDGDPSGDIPVCAEHQWSVWEPDVEPTCTEVHQYRICSVCQAREEKTIPAVHSWSDWEIYMYPDCGTAGQKYRYCFNCDEYEERTIPPTGKHEWDSWYTVTGASIFHTGVRERYCMTCWATQRGTIAKLKPFAKFTAKKYTVYKGKSKQMKSVLGMASGDSVKSWKSSKKKVVSITKSGKIKAKKKGTAKITVILKSGKKATCTIKVVKKPKASKKSSGGSVYITRTGYRYHCDKDCWGLRNANAIYKVSLSKAKKKGLTKCHVCY